MYTLNAMQVILGKSVCMQNVFRKIIACVIHLVLLFNALNYNLRLVDCWTLIQFYTPKTMLTFNNTPWRLFLLKTDQQHSLVSLGWTCLPCLARWPIHMGQVLYHHHHLLHYQGSRWRCHWGWSHHRRRSWWRKGDGTLWDPGRGVTETRHPGELSLVSPWAHRRSDCTKTRSTARLQRWREQEHIIVNSITNITNFSVSMAFTIILISNSGKKVKTFILNPISSRKGYRHAGLKFKNSV